MGWSVKKFCLKHYFEPREPKQERQLADVQRDIEALQSANEEIESEIQSLGWNWQRTKVSLRSSTISAISCSALTISSASVRCC